MLATNKVCKIRSEIKPMHFAYTPNPLMNHFAFPEPILAQLYNTGLVAVIVLDDPQDALPLARALIAGGIGALELTLRTPVAIEAVKRIRQHIPEMLVGVGTILTLDQVQQVKAADAAFGVAPGMNPRIVAEANRIGLPFAPGICTPSDIEIALEAGCRLMKFFPAEPSGGLAYLRSLAAPYAHLDIKYLPLGGIELRHAAMYLKDPLVHALGGSWLAPRPLIQAGDWSAITNQAREAMAVVRSLRGGAQ